MAFLQPPASQQPAFNVPPAAAALLALLIATHVARALVAPELSDVIVARYAFNPALYSQAFLTAHNITGVTLWDRVVPFVGYIFLHADATHLAINCLWLLAFGSVVARRLGGSLFLLFFLTCGIAGALTQLLCAWGEYVPMIGASAAISGLMAAGIRMLPLGNPQASVSPPLQPIRASGVLLFSLIWAIVNVAAGLTGFAGVGTEVRSIAWQAHLGGYFCGLLLAGPFYRLKQHEPIATA